MSWTLAVAQASCLCSAPRWVDYLLRRRNKLFSAGRALQIVLLKSMHSRILCAPYLFKETQPLSFHFPYIPQAGAKHVYGIECSAIADQAKQIVEDNGYSDKITIIKGKVRMGGLRILLLVSTALCSLAP